MSKVDVSSVTAGSAVSTLSEELRTTTDANHAFFITVAAVELLRRLKNPEQIRALSSFLQTLVEIGALENWNKINFSLTQHLLTSTYDSRLLAAGISNDEIPVAMTAALSLFVDRVVHNPESLETRVATINDMAQSVEAIFGAVADDPPPADDVRKLAAPNVEPPPVFDMYARPPYFDCPRVTPETLSAINAEFISYRGNLTSGELGPEIRGLSLEGPDGRLHTFLETGEYLVLKPGMVGLATYTDPQDIKAFPPCLLLFAMLAAETLHDKKLITNEQRALLTGGAYGKISGGTSLESVAAAADIEPIAAVLQVDSRDVAIEAARPVVVNFQLDETKSARISGVYAKSGSFVTAKLIETVDGREKVRLVHTVPRFFSACGVYIFPLVDDDELLSLTIID